MTLTTTYRMTLDDDGHAPLELTWEIEYVPSSNKTFVIREKTVTAIVSWINGNGYDVERFRYDHATGTLFDAYRDAEIAYTHLLDEEELLAKCQEHWDVDGHREWNEPGRAA